MKKFRKQTTYDFYVFIKKLNSAKCVTKERSYEAYCPITQAWRVQCPNSFKNSLVITNHVREFCYGFAEVMGSNPAQDWTFFLALFLLLLK